MTRSQPSYERDPHALEYDAEPEPIDSQAAWSDEESDLGDTHGEPVIDDPLAFADQHMARLGLTLDFGPGDLAFNRGAQLSPAQIARLENDLRLFYLPMSAALGVFALLIGLAGALGSAVPMVMLALVLMGCAAIPAWLMRRETERLPDRVVVYTTLRLGGLALTARRWGLSDSLPVDGGKPIFAPKHLYKVLRANQTYLAYYVPMRTWRGYRLLSLEPHQGGTFEKPKRKTKRSSQ